MKQASTFLFLFICFSALAKGQVFDNSKKKLVKLPPEFGTVSIMVQPDCPVKIREPQLYVKPDGSVWDIRYIVLNESGKGIRYLSYGFLHKSYIPGWGKYAHGFEDRTGQDDGKGEIFLESLDFIDEIKQSEFEIVPMTKGVKDLFTNKKGNIEMRTFWIAMVTKVVFEDGTTFDATKL